MPIEDMRNDQSLLKAKSLARLNIDAGWDYSEEHGNLLKQSLITNATAIKDMDCERGLAILKSRGLDDLIFVIEDLRKRDVTDFDLAYYVSCEVAYCRDVEVGVNVLAKLGQSNLSKHIHTLATDLLIFDYFNCED